jgi:hypothetical protein
MPVRGSAVPTVNPSDVSGIVISDAVWTLTSTRQPLGSEPEPAFSRATAPAAPSLGSSAESALRPSTSITLIPTARRSTTRISRRSARPITPLWMLCDAPSYCGVSRRRYDARIITDTQKRGGSARSASPATATPPKQLRCSTCRRDLPLSSFFLSNTKARGYGYRCRECSRAYSRTRNELAHVKEQARIARERRKAADPVGVHAQKRRAALLRSFDLSYEEYEALRAATTTCEICGTNDPGKKGWVVDHERGVARVRGVLCDLCNRGLGFFRHDSAALRAAALYLSERKCSTPPCSKGRVCARHLGLIP